MSGSPQQQNFMIPSLNMTSSTEVFEVANLGVLLTGLFDSPECNVLVCNWIIPLSGLMGDLGGLLNLLV